MKNCHSFPLSTKEINSGFGCWRTVLDLTYFIHYFDQLNSWTAEGKQQSAVFKVEGNPSKLSNFAFEIGKIFYITISEYSLIIWTPFLLLYLWGGIVSLKGELSSMAKGITAPLQDETFTIFHFNHLPIPKILILAIHTSFCIHMFI